MTPLIALAILAVSNEPARSDSQRMQLVSAGQPQAPECVEFCGEEERHAYIDISGTTTVITTETVHADDPQPTWR